MFTEDIIRNVIHQRFPEVHIHRIDGTATGRITIVLSNIPPAQVKALKYLIHYNWPTGFDYHLQVINNTPTVCRPDAPYKDIE